MSFIASSAYPDESLHGAGFGARFTGAKTEFLSIWSVMMAGARPFFMQDGELHLAFKPVLPGWLFDADRRATFTFLGNCTVTYHDLERLDTFKDGMQVRKIMLDTKAKVSRFAVFRQFCPPRTEKLAEIRPFWLHYVQYGGQFRTCVPYFMLASDNRETFDKRWPFDRAYG